MCVVLIYKTQSNSDRDHPGFFLTIPSKNPGFFGAPHQKKKLYILNYLCKICIKMDGRLHLTMTLRSFLIRRILRNSKTWLSYILTPTTASDRKLGWMGSLFSSIWIQQNIWLCVVWYFGRWWILKNEKLMKKCFFWWFVAPEAPQTIKKNIFHQLFIFQNSSTSYVWYLYW